jgi:tetratricopeptide (TPR) repeat protein
VERPVALRGAFQQLTPLVGRADLQAQAESRIRDWLNIRHDPQFFDMAAADSPLADHNKLLILGGASAIGKSRLAFEIVQALRAEQQLASASVHCTERASVRGYTAELAQIAGLTPENLLERWEQLCAASAAAVSPEYAERQRRHLPLLAHVLDCQKLDTSDIAAMDVSSFETGCRLACRACCELASHCDGSAVLLVIEDLQWLGDLKDAIQDLLCHACLPRPLIALATARPQYQHEDGDLGEGESCALQLTPLTAADGDLLLDALLPGLKLPTALLAELHDKANGIPYYYEEFARMLERRGLVAVHNGSCSLASELDELDVPEDVRALVLGRLDQLEPRLKELAMRASVLGRSFSFEMLTALEAELGFSAPGHPGAELEMLIKQHVLVKEPSERFFFEHVLLREAAYGALLHHNRRILHQAAARVMESMFVPGSVDEFQLMSNRITHLFHAEQYEQAQINCGKLLLAQARSGRFENWDLWEQLAAECMAKSDGGRADTGQPCFTLLRARGVKLLRQGEYSASSEYIEQSLQAAREAGDEAGVAGALCDLGILSRYAGRAEEALDYYQQALQIAERIGDHQMEAVILGNIGKVHYFQGYVNLAIAHYDQGLAISREHGDKRSEALMLVYLGALHLDHGNSELAMELYSKVLDLARQTGNRVSESLALSNLGVAAHSFGRNDQARELWQQAATIDREIGFKEGEAFNLFNLAELACDAVEFDSALTCFEQSLNLFREQNNFVQTIIALAGRGKVLAMLGRLEEAAASLTEASAMCESREGRVEAGIADCCWIYYNLANNDLPTAQARLAQARDTAQAVNAGSQSQLTLEIARAERLLEAAASHEQDPSAPQSYAN